MSENYDPLDLLLSAVAEVTEKSQNEPKSLKETSIFLKETNIPTVPLSSVTKSSVLHAGDTDSSEDEDSRIWEERKYTENGREIKRLLDNRTDNAGSSVEFKRKRLSHSNVLQKPPQPSLQEKIRSNSNIVKSQPTQEQERFDVYIDPIFRLRIVNPLISSTVLKDRMIGREPVTFSRLSRFLQINAKGKDWVLAGVIVNKSAPKVSQKGHQFSVWTLSDLKDDIKTASVFLFSGAHGQLWKTAVGTVVGLLNPNVLDKNDGRDEASLSIDNAQKVMIFGQSKDFGMCKSVKKNGDKCTAIVNISRCEYCVYHIKQEYQKCSIRSDLQSTFNGRGLTALRNKVLGKNEVFYAGKSYTAIPAKRSKKLEVKDSNRLSDLQGKGTTSQKSSNTRVKKKSAQRLEVSHAQKMKDIKLLEKLNGTLGLDDKNTFEGKQSSDISLDEAKILANSVLNKLKAKKQNSENEKGLNEAKSFATTVSDKGKSSADAETVANSVLTKSKDKQQDLESQTATSSNTLDLDNEKGLDLNEAKSSKAKDKQQDLENQTASSNNTLVKGLGAKSSVAIVSDKVKSSTNKNLNKSAEIEQKTNKLASFKSTGPMDTIKLGFPKLSGFDSGLVDLNKPITPRRIEKAKLNAIKIIKKVGPIKKADPNNIRGTGIKRSINTEGEMDSEAKKMKVETNSFASERFKKIMAASSAHQDLLEARDEEEKEKYFFKLEAKERMEDKMISTQKVACKAVKCLQCKYVSFSASELCKSERHPLKVFDAFKRFYKCSNCQNRTACLEIVPLKDCGNCGGSKWEKTGMMKEKLITSSHVLSIRGGEQKNLNSVVMDANVNLLVPD